MKIVERHVVQDDRPVIFKMVQRHVVEERVTDT